MTMQAPAAWWDSQALVNALLCSLQKVRYIRDPCWERDRDIYAFFRLSRESARRQSQQSQEVFDFHLIERSWRFLVPCWYQSWGEVERNLGSLWLESATVICEKGKRNKSTARQDTTQKERKLPTKRNMRRPLNNSDNLGLRSLLAEAYNSSSLTSWWE